MPFVENIQYQPPVLFRNGHINTIIPNLFRHPPLEYQRERVELPDGDFIDLDWSKRRGYKLVLAIHGLEGSAEAGYMKGVIKAFNQNGWDGVAMNLRGCSGEPNRLLRAYHSGATEDLQAILAHIMSTNNYQKINIIGFSLGGNLALKFMGERGDILDPAIERAAAISVPVDLKSCAGELTKPRNFLYQRRFIKRLATKVAAKTHLLPKDIKIGSFKGMRSLREFDDAFTAPVHGFSDAEDYWRQSSARQYLPLIKRPVLLINAVDDPFLSPECFPVQEAKNSNNFYFMMPKFGGHVGFVPPFGKGYYWHERQILEFFSRN